VDDRGTAVPRVDDLDRVHALLLICRYDHSEGDRWTSGWMAAHLDHGEFGNTKIVNHGSLPPFDGSPRRAFPTSDAR
jgi:hypothetical protein